MRTCWAPCSLAAEARASSAKCRASARRPRISSGRLLNLRPRWRSDEWMKRNSVIYLNWGDPFRCAATPARLEHPLDDQIVLLQLHLARRHASFPTESPAKGGGNASAIVGDAIERWRPVTRGSVVPVRPFELGSCQSRFAVMGEWGLPGSGGCRYAPQSSCSGPLNPSPMSAPTATPQTSNATCSRSTWMGWCSGFVLSGRSSTWRSSTRR